MRIFKIILLIYGLLSLPYFISGLSGAHQEKKLEFNVHCLNKRTRLQTIFPAYALGCYLNGDGSK